MSMSRSKSSGTSETRSPRSCVGVWLAAAGALLSVAACGGESPVPDAAGAAPPSTATVTTTEPPAAELPVTLTIATNDNDGGAMAVPIDEFARQVDALSGGQIRIEPVWEAGPTDEQVVGEYIAWDQFVARRVVDGEFDLGMIPARAWDTEGVTSLRALFAPFLIDSNDVLAAVITDDDLAGDLLSGFDGSGVTGLALVPESLRHIFSFGEPITGPGDFEGATIRAPRSATSYALFEALGAQADDPRGAEFENSVVDGSVTGAESSLERAYTLPGGRPTLSASLTPYPNINSLVVNSKRLESLTAEQRQVLVDAALLTRDAFAAQLPDEVQAAADFCAEIGDVVVSTPDEFSAFSSATEPVYAELQREPRTTALIERIGAIKSHQAAPIPIAACAHAGDEALTDDKTIPFGRYSRTVTRTEAEAGGADPGFVDEVFADEDGLDNSWEFADDGLWTQYSDFCRCGQPERGDFGTYTYDDEGRLVMTSFNTNSRDLVAIVEWTVSDDALLLVSMTGLTPTGDPREIDPIESLLTLGEYQRTDRSG